jgi:hypothetical protein
MSKEVRTKEMNIRAGGAEKSYCLMGLRPENVLVVLVKVGYATQAISTMESRVLWKREGMFEDTERLTRPLLESSLV